MKRTLSAAAVGVILLTSAACGGDSDDTATSSPQDSPLTEYLGGGAGGGPGMSVSINGSDNDADQEQQQRVQQLVVECMKEAGFEYLPYVPTFPEMQPMIEGDREWAATYGYGITTVDAPTPDSSDDPNTAITERMSDSERAAYDKALYGSGMTMSGSGGPGRLAVAGPAGGGPVAAPGGAMPPSGDTPPSRCALGRDPFLGGNIERRRRPHRLFPDSICRGLRRAGGVRRRRIHVAVRVSREAGDVGR